MSRSRKHRRDRIRQYLRSHGVNTAPGSISEHPDAPQPVITVIAYNAHDLVEQRIKDPKEIEAFIKKYPVTWVNVDGFGDVDKIKAIASLFKIHNLALEDVMTFHQRAKVESYDHQYYIVAHMLEWYEGEIRGEQLNIFLGKNFVVTFQDGPIDCMNSVRERLRKGVGKMRSSGPDYLAYSLLDTVIDTFFPILENYGDSLENLEELIIEKPTRRAIAQIHKIKRELLLLRRAIWPLREAINSLLRDTPEAFAPETIIHLRDCYDHTVQILDFIETYRELSADLQDVYLSSISNRMNEIMKVLTIVSTLCVPPTLVAGVYGMNFDTKVSHWNMPELNWYYGYPFALGLMLIIVIITLVGMWSKGWLGDNPFSSEDKDISPSDLVASDKDAKAVSLDQRATKTSSAGAKPMSELASATPHHLGDEPPAVGKSGKPDDAAAQTGSNSGKLSASAKDSESAKSSDFANSSESAKSSDSANSSESAKSSDSAKEPDSGKHGGLQSEDKTLRLSKDSSANSSASKSTKAESDDPNMRVTRGGAEVVETSKSGAKKSGNDEGPKSGGKDYSSDDEGNSSSASATKPNARSSAKSDAKTEANSDGKTNAKSDAKSAEDPGSSKSKDLKADGKKKK